MAVDVWLVEYAGLNGYGGMVCAVTEDYESALDAAIDYWYGSYSPNGYWLSEPQNWDLVASVVLYEFNPAGRIVGEYTISHWY